MSYCVEAGERDSINVCASCEISSLGEAIGKVDTGGVITLEKGVYRESDIFLDFPVSIIGKPGAVLDVEERSFGIVVRSDSVEINGLTILNVGRSFTKDFAAIKVVKSKHVQLNGNTLQNVFFGIVLEKSKNCSVLNNEIRSNSIEEYNSGNGIHLWYCQHIQIRDNRLSGLRDGIYLEFVDDSEIVNNISSDNLRYGLHFMFSNRDSYSCNIFRSNGAGVAVMFSKEIEMVENDFDSNWGSASYGLLLKEINDAWIYRNNFRNNTIAINLEGSNRIVYKENIFAKNGWAVKMQGACFANHFEYNNFLYNTFDISHNGQWNDNQFDHNYWSAYSGYDLDRDGIGDVPFRPVKLFSYVVNRTPESIVLLRSLFVDILNFSEHVSPVFTTGELSDPNPLMKQYNDRDHRSA